VITVPTSAKKKTEDARVESSQKKKERRGQPYGWAGRENPLTQCGEGFWGYNRKKGASPAKGKKKRGEGRGEINRNKEGKTTKE